MDAGHFISAPAPWAVSAYKVLCRRIGVGNRRRLQVAAITYGTAADLHFK